MRPRKNKDPAAQNAARMLDQGYYDGLEAVPAMREDPEWAKLSDLQRELMQRVVGDTERDILQWALDRNRQSANLSRANGPIPFHARWNGGTLSQYYSFSIDGVEVIRYGFPPLIRAIDAQLERRAVRKKQEAERAAQEAADNAIRKLLTKPALPSASYDEPNVDDIIQELDGIIHDQS